LWIFLYLNRNDNDCFIQQTNGEMMKKTSARIVLRNGNIIEEDAIF